MRLKDNSNKVGLVKIKMEKDTEKNMKTVRLSSTLTFTHELAVRSGIAP